MRQAIVGVSIFVGLQLVYVIVLLGVTMWERRLDRPRRVAEPASKPIAQPSDGPLDRAA